MRLKSRETSEEMKEQKKNNNNMKNKRCSKDEYRAKKKGKNG